MNLSILYQYSLKNIFMEEADSNFHNPFDKRDLFQKTYNHWINYTFQMKKIY